MSSVYVAGGSVIVAARMAGESPEMDRAANRVLRAVRSVAPKVTFAYVNSLKVVSVPGVSGTGRTVRDRLVVADDPGAAAIEWGHYAYSRTKQGRRVTTGQITWVPGQHPMARGLALVGTSR